MTLKELQMKVLELMQLKDNGKLEVYFFAEDEYQTFDVKIDNIEIEDNKIFLS